MNICSTIEKATGQNTKCLASYRAFGGHWMLFYGMAYAVMHSIIRKPKQLQKRQCVAGHEVGQEDRFCPNCGQSMPPEAGAASGQAG